MALVDNCSSINLINEAKLNETNHTPVNASHLHQISLKTLGGLISTKGQVQIKFKLGDRIFSETFYIIANWTLPSDLILGLPFLRNNPVHYDGPKNSLILGDKLTITPVYTKSKSNVNLSLFSVEYNIPEPVHIKPKETKILTINAPCTKDKVPYALHTLNHEILVENNDTLIFAIALVSVCVFSLGCNLYYGLHVQDSEKAVKDVAEELKNP